MADELIAGRYRLIEPLGRGSMSAVWLAEDVELGRHVAVKLLAPSADRERFAREARAVAALSHPNICALYDYGEADGRRYMVLEYLPNGSLEDRLQANRPLPDDETARIAGEVAAGLAHAHDRGLVHRDLKPANILFDAEGRAKIADFGIARMSGTGTLTDAGTVLGTASYISPEQAAGLPAGPASDVYSFGVILFRMTTGRLPFVSSNAMELVRMHRDDPPLPLDLIRPDVPPVLAAVVTASLAKDPAARPADGRALLDELRGDATAETRVLPRAAPPAKKSRWPVLAIGASVAALLLGGAAVAIALTQGGGGSGTTVPSLTLPSVPVSTVTTTAATTTAPATTHETTTAPTTTGPPTTTAPTTTAPTTSPATTTTPPTTTAPTTTPTTTAPPPTTETTPTTETAPTTTG